MPTPDDNPPRNFVDDDHALTAGYVLGTLMRSGVTCWPEVDTEGNYLPVICIGLDGGKVARLWVVADDALPGPPATPPAPVYDALGKRVEAR